jgi:hypothetical protein
MNRSIANPRSNPRVNINVIGKMAGRGRSTIAGGASSKWRAPPKVGE